MSSQSPISQEPTIDLKPELQTDTFESPLPSLIAAHGGDAFLAIRTLTMEGRGVFTTPPQTGALAIPVAHFVYRVSTGGRCHFEARSAGFAFSLTNRGYDKGGSVVIGGRSQPLTPDVTNFTDLIELLRNAYRHGYPATPVSSDASISATNCYRFERTDNNSTVFNLDVDRESGLITRISTTNNRGELSIYLSDYREITDLPIFGKIRIQENGKDMFELTASTITINEPIEDRWFR